MKVSVSGLGKLGLPLACLLYEAGNDVYATDISPDVLLKVKNQEAPFFEPGLDALLAVSDLRTGDDATQAAWESQVHFIVVPTPSGADGFFTNKYVLEAVEAIGRGIKGSIAYHVVVVVSTVMPGSGTNDIIPAIEKASGKKLGDGWGYCYNPEFIALGTVIRDMKNPDFILIGASDDLAAKTLCQAIEFVTDIEVPMAIMSIINAEIAKLTLNTYITMKISFANQLAEVCENVYGGDATIIAKAIGLDQRIGQKCLIPATPYGGPCFPRDSVAFTAFADSLGVTTELAEATQSVNQRQLRRLYSLIRWNSTLSTKVAVMGLAYKVGTSVVEEAFGTKILKWLRSDKYMSVVGYDPIVAPSVDYSDANLFIICTPCPEFAGIDFGDATVIDFWGIAQSGTIMRVGTSDFHL